jgi:LEA14-like dessication related protein
MDKIDYKVYGNDTYLGSGEVTKKIEIPPSGVKTVDTSFTFKYADAGEAIRSAAKEGTMKWEVKGTTYLHAPTGDIKVPLKFAESAE